MAEVKKMFRPCAYEAVGCERTVSVRSSKQICHACETCERRHISQGYGHIQEWRRKMSFWADRAGLVGTKRLTHYRSAMRRRA